MYDKRDPLGKLGHLKRLQAIKQLGFDKDDVEFIQFWLFSYENSQYILMDDFIRYYKSVVYTTSQITFDIGDFVPPSIEECLIGFKDYLSQHSWLNQLEYDDKVLKFTNKFSDYRPMKMEDLSGNVLTLFRKFLEVARNNDSIFGINDTDLDSFSIKGNDIIYNNLTGLMFWFIPQSIYATNIIYNTPNEWFVLDPLSTLSTSEGFQEYLKNIPGTRIEGPE